MLDLSSSAERSGRPLLAIRTTTVFLALAVTLLGSSELAFAQPTLLARNPMTDEWSCHSATACEAGCEFGESCFAVAIADGTADVCLPTTGGVLCCGDDTDCEVDGVMGSCESIGDGTDVCVFGVEPFCASGPNGEDALECYTKLGVPVAEWSDGDCDGDATPNGQDACLCEMGTPEAGGCPAPLDGGVTGGDGGEAVPDGGALVDGGASGGQDGGAGGGMRAPTGGFEGAGGCGCSTTRPREAPASAFLAMGAFGLALVLRRRRR
jgi:MYXO-CTERM domain-containing protein